MSGANIACLTRTNLRRRRRARVLLAQQALRPRPQNAISPCFCRAASLGSAPNDGAGEPVSWRVRLMGSLSIWHWIIVIAVVLLLFGRGKISELMGDVAQGIKAFKKGMSEDEVAKTETKPDGMKVVGNG